MYLSKNTKYSLYVILFLGLIYCIWVLYLFFLGGCFRKQNRICTGWYFKWCRQKRELKV